MVTFVGGEPASCSIEVDPKTKKAGAPCNQDGTITSIDDNSVVLTDNSYSVKVNMQTYFETEET